MVFKKVLVFTFVLVTLVNLINGANNRLDSVFKGAENVKCNNKTDKKADDLMPLLVPVGTDIQMPETAKDLRKYCNLYSKNFPFVLGYLKHCSSPFAQTIAKFMVFPIRKQMDNICKTGKLGRLARELITASKCGNKAREPFRECNIKLIDALNGIVLAPVKDRIYMTCCHANAYRLCLREGADETDGCTRLTVDWAERFVLKMMGGSIDLVCGEYFQESDKCTKLINETPKPKYSKSYRRPKSFIRPMIYVMEGLPDVQT